MAALDAKVELRLIRSLPICDLKGVGLELGISQHTLSVIQKNNSMDVTAQKREILAQWLHQDIRASYKRLAEVLHRHDPPEVESIEKLANKLGCSVDALIPHLVAPPSTEPPSFPQQLIPRKRGQLSHMNEHWPQTRYQDKNTGLGHVLDPEDIDSLFEVVNSAKSKWRDIGRELGFTLKELDYIVQKKGISQDQDYFQELLDLWLNWAPPERDFPFTEDLLEALRRIGQHRLALKLENTKEFMGMKEQTKRSLQQDQSFTSISDSKKLYDDAMKNGCIERKVIKCLIVGAAGVGKTSIKHLILNKKLPEKRVSTGVAENPTVAVSFSRDSKSRDVCISRANMKVDGSWNVVHNDEELLKMIAELIKSGVPKSSTSLNSQETYQNSATTSQPRIDDNLVATVEQDQDQLVTAIEMLKPEVTAGIQEVSIHNQFISAIVEAKGGEMLSTTWIHFIDSGGQPEFHDLLPVFAPDTSVVLFVFKLSEGLDEKPMVEYYGPMGAIGGSYKSYLTHREILEHCLAVFRAQGEQCPTILLVGTHKDCSEQKIKINELQECLKPFQKKVVYFGVDKPIALLNCLSNETEEKEIVEDIRSQILEVDIKKEPTPMAWFGLELALKKASQSENSKHKGILTLKQCKQEADKFEFFKTNHGQFDAALQHLVKHNIFLNYPHVLPDVVFCDPQVLLTMVTQIVQFHYKLKHSKCSFKGTRLMFVDNAYISADILNSVSSQWSDKEGVLPSESFFNLLLYLKIISVIHTSGSADVYLMPALLPNADDPSAKVGEIKGMELLPPLCISFDGGCAPSGVFCSLTATLLQLDNWKLCMKNYKPHCCFRNCVTFAYGGKIIVTLVNFFSHFSIYMYIPEYSKSRIDIRKIVHESISTVTKVLQYSTLNIQDAIKCPSHPEENHVALWHLPEPSDEEEYYKCTVEDVCTGPIPEEYQVWMKNSAILAVQPPQSDTHRDQRPPLAEHFSPPNPGTQGFINFLADNKIEDADIQGIAENLSDWQAVAKKLGFGHVLIEEIEGSNNRGIHQAKAFLRKWIAKHGSGATYKKLHDVLLLELKDRGAAEAILAIAKKSYSTVQQ